MDNGKSVASLPGYCFETLISCYLWPPNMTKEMKVTPRIYVKALCFYMTSSIPLYFTFYHMIYGRKTTLDVLFYEASIVIIYVCMKTVGFVYLGQLQSIVNMAFSLPTYFTNSTEQKKLRSRQNIKFRIVQNLIVFLGVAYVVIRIIDEPNCRRKLRKDTLDFCGLLFPLEISEAYDHFPVRQIVSILQCASVVILFRALAALLSLCICGLEQIEMNIKLLKKALRMLDTNMPMSFYKNFFKEFVITHNNIIKFTNVLNDITYYIHFLHITCTSIEFAILTIDIYLHHNWASMINFMGWLSGLYYLSKLCQDIYDECEALCHEVYSIEWYSMDTQVKRYVHLILIATQRPIVIYAGPFANVSVETFMKLLKMATSYMTMLINLQA